MPRADADAGAGLRIERIGTSLRFAGALTRANVADAWRHAARQLEGIDAFDLTAVDRVDSAGVALLAELAARAGAAVAQSAVAQSAAGKSAVAAVTMSGDPPGLADLRGAYRLQPSLAFAA